MTHRHHVTAALAFVGVAILAGAQLATRWPGVTA